MQAQCKLRRAVQMSNGISDKPTAAPTCLQLQARGKNSFIFTGPSPPPPVKALLCLIQHKMWDKHRECP